MELKKCGFLSIGRKGTTLNIYVDKEELDVIAEKDPEALSQIEKAFDAMGAKEQFIQSTNMANCNAIAMDISNDFTNFGLRMSADAVLHGVTKCIGAMGEEKFQRMRFDLGVNDFYSYLMDAVYVK